MAFELKISHPFVISPTPTLRSPGAPASDLTIQEGLDLLFGRLHAAGEIPVGDPVWCRRVYLALLHEVHELPVDSPVLTATEDAAADDISTRVQLLIRTLVAALGGLAGTTGASRR